MAKMDKIDEETKMNTLEHLIGRLRQDLVLRRIESGIEKLREHRKLLDSLDTRQKQSAVLVGHIAQWVDIGFDHPGLLKEIVSRFLRSERAELRMNDYVHLRMAEGLVAMYEEDFEQAIRYFSIVLSFEDDIQNKELVAITSFWIGRCHRRIGQYRDALNYVVRGRKLAAEMNHPKMSAVMQVLEGWIAFQEGKPSEALRILGEAEVILSDTDDYVTLGNIQSAYGRIARRQGRVQQALAHFQRAIEQYQKRNPQHNNVARSLVNIAYVERLIALQLRNRIDNKALRRRKSGRTGNTGAIHSIKERESFQRLHEQALAHLAAALKIYDMGNDHRGKGGVHITCGYLYLDEGDLDRAWSEATAAYDLGSQKNDYILRARARILQSAVANVRFEEQLEDAPSHHGHPAQLASDCAREAIEYAKHTQSRRLLAKAYIALGLTLSMDFFDDLGAAQQCCDKAAGLLDPDNQDYVWRELQTLKQKLLRTGRMDSTLREWSQGVVGDKTFQQISEEFSEIIIPSVWKREGRKISRVASRLSISPKKVRRILRHVGILDHSSKNK